MSGAGNRPRRSASHTARVDVGSRRTVTRKIVDLDRGLFFSSLCYASGVEPLCLDDLDDAALDRLPFGVVCLSPDGTVERYNRAESERAGIQRWRALGRDFFRDVAIRDGATLAKYVSALGTDAHVRVFHTLHASHRADDAVIDISRCAAGKVTLVIRFERA